jgi:hypothetical protein
LIIDTVTIGKRFNGPPQSANGGWTGGILARSLSLPTEQAGCVSYPSVSVSLRAPPPLDIALEVHRNADASLSLKHEGLELAHARLETFELDIPKPPLLPTANAASAEGYQRGLSRASWPYAKCFACGVSRTDGLCITPSPVRDSNQGGVIAASWTPSAWLAETEGSLDELVRLEAVWAALDCPAGIAWSFQLPDGAPMVTARMSVSITRLPRVKQVHIVMGWPIEREGRKLYAGTALTSAEGEVLASSRQLWLLPKGD